MIGPLELTKISGIPVVDVCIEEEKRLCDCPAPHGGRHVQRSLTVLVHRARHSAGPDQAAGGEKEYISWIQADNTKGSLGAIYQ